MKIFTPKGRAKQRLREGPELRVSERDSGPNKGAGEEEDAREREREKARREFQGLERVGHSFGAWRVAEY